MAEALIAGLIAPAAIYVLRPTLTLLGRRLKSWAEDKLEKGAK